MSGGQRGAFTTPCPRRNAAPRPLVYKSRKLPRRGVPTGAGRPGAIAATRPGIAQQSRPSRRSREGGDCEQPRLPGGEVTNSGRATAERDARRGGTEGEHRKDDETAATARRAERRATELVTSPEGSPARFRGAARRSIPGKA